VFFVLLSSSSSERKGQREKEQTEASRYWNERAFKASIDRHVLEANDFTAIDLTAYGVPMHARRRYTE